MNFVLLTTVITVLLSTQPIFQTRTRDLVVPLVFPQPTQETHQAPELLARQELSLNNRHANESINEIFRKNILLNLAYFSQSVKSKSEINWDTVQQPTGFSIVLEPGQTFAYHDDVLPEYQDRVALTTQAHFDSREGFLSSGFLFGDGVCHLASVINWAAQDAELAVQVTKLHTIAPIPGIPDKYGVSIYTQAGVKGSGAKNNLYITNNKDFPVEFIFDYQPDNVIAVTVAKASPVANPVALHHK